MSLFVIRFQPYSAEPAPASVERSGVELRGVDSVGERRAPLVDGSRESSDSWWSGAHARWTKVECGNSFDSLKFFKDFDFNLIR